MQRSGPRGRGERGHAAILNPRARCSKIEAAEAVEFAWWTRKRREGKCGLHSARELEESPLAEMAHRLVPPDGCPYLSPRLVVSRLESEFAYVEVDEEDGRRHVRGIIRQLQKMRDLGLIPVDDEYLARLKKAQRGAIYVYFGDDPGSEIACLNTAVIPGEPLFFDYASRAHEQAAHPLLARCAEVLGYNIVEA